jgi:hypothetical protein
MPKKGIRHSHGGPPDQNRKGVAPVRRILLASALGCRISGLAQRELVVEVEVTAVKGAGGGIQWTGPDAVDPLDAS